MKFKADKYFIFNCGENPLKNLGNSQQDTLCLVTRCEHCILGKLRFSKHVGTVSRTMDIIYLYASHVILFYMAYVYIVPEAESMPLWETTTHWLLPTIPFRISYEWVINDPRQFKCSLVSIRFYFDKCNLQHGDITDIVYL